MTRCGRRGPFRCIVLLTCGLCLGGLASTKGALAETALDSRPSDRVAPELTRRLQALADQIGWGSLFRTEQMARADTAYGAGSVLAVTATPRVPVLSYLESRAWAVERFQADDAADRRFAELYLDPATAIVFDLLVIGATSQALEAEALGITYRDDSGLELAGMLEGYDVTREPTLGGALHAGRGRIRIDLPDGHDWAQIDEMSLRLRAASQDFALVWVFPSQP